MTKNFLKLDNFPSHTPHDALQWFVRLSQAVYPQCVSWQPETCVPFPTLKRRPLATWYFLSLVVILGTFFVAVKILREILSSQRDSEMTIQSGALCIIGVTMGTVVSTTIFTLVLKTEEFCFVLKNLGEVKNSLSQNGKSSHITWMDWFDLLLIKLIYSIQNE